MKKLIKKLTKRIGQGGDCVTAEVWARALQTVCTSRAIELDNRRKETEFSYNLWFHRS